MPSVLDLSDSLKLLKKYHIPVAESIMVSSSAKAVAAAKKVGFPVVMKLVSDISHKTEAGGVQVNLNSPGEVKKAFETIVKSAKKYKRNAKIQGVLVQPFLKGHEVIVGGKLDAQFGPTVLFGYGGIFVEVFEDVSLRIAPVDSKTAEEMIREIKAFKVLQGYRNLPKADLASLKKVIVQVSKLMENEDVSELDINPLIVNSKGAVAVDARVVSKE